MEPGQSSVVAVLQPTGWRRAGRAGRVGASKGISLVPSLPSFHLLIGLLLYFQIFGSSTVSTIIPMHRWRRSETLAVVTCKSPSEHSYFCGVSIIA